MPNDLKSELIAIQESAAIFPITDRAFLRVTGSDAARWLNGMVTNSIQTLAPGEGNYNFLLNAQGRIQGDCTIYRDTADTAEFLLATSAAQVETIQQHLDRFIIMDDVELEAAYGDESGILLLGPDAPKSLAALGLPALDPLRLAHADTEHGPALLLTPASGSVTKIEVRAATATIESLRQTLNAPELSTEAIESLRLLEAVPLFGQDIRDRDLPQETAQTHALHFAKGCYLGQEIVERIRSRGHVHRQFTSFRLTGDLPATLPAPLEASGKLVGELTSAILVPLAEGPTLLALGYARREALEESKATKQTFTYAGGVATPHPSNLKS